MVAALRPRNLNDPYRRVINRNKPFASAADLSAPDIIVRNERAMPAESVDALLDQRVRAAVAITAPTKRP